ncbi:hypothetical protein [Xenorhabdus bovienii]|uniref:hypothetical protein n=1 Tax=Xenorhabdus bovienii TaxID=40576 RepID=UPI000B108E64|nr:hypothetical protein [Xenorhabdus bovienii]MDE1473801.1 hypothetical protein [Xenorhabdus bovienii]MDE9431508.1 hypothetical protein [Xenorhabdus bovienii]MDE9464225.1 hypothetical protein [Xenorhabdus bovienii]MDE9489054.1 hypothetical protein [Xenorhabdus bovienii]MDE9505500.1 hypothetical protein [Xenorhabdus bovienii]
MLQTSTRSQHGCRASGGYAAVYRGTLLVASSVFEKVTSFLNLAIKMTRFIELHCRFENSHNLFV